MNYKLPILIILVTLYHGINFCSNELLKKAIEQNDFKKVQELIQKPYL